MKKKINIHLATTYAKNSKSKPICNVKILKMSCPELAFNC